MIRYNLLILIITSLLMVSGCGQTSETATNSSLEAQAWTMIEQGALLVDVRTQQEYDQGAIQGALHIPHDQIADRLSELGSDKNR